MEYLPCAAMVISLLAFVASLIASSHTFQRESMRELRAQLADHQERIEQLEGKLATCIERRDALEEHNYRLMAQVLTLQKQAEGG